MAFKTGKLDIADYLIDKGIDVDFMEAGLLDSYDIVSLVTNLEITFNFRINGTDVVPENFTSVDAIIAMLGKYGVH